MGDYLYTAALEHKVSELEEHNSKLKSLLKTAFGDLRKDPFCSMTIEEAILQLEDLKKDIEHSAEKDEPDGVFIQDVKAMGIAINVLREQATGVKEDKDENNGSDE